MDRTKEDYIFINGEEINFIKQLINELQIVFHPEFAKDGYIDYSKLLEYKKSRKLIVFLDRNMLSSLLKLCTQGSLEDEIEARIVGLFMIWTILNDIPISAGPAIQERATQINNQDEGLKELNTFLKIFDYYPSQMWLQLARGEISRIPTIGANLGLNKDWPVDYSNGNDHYYMTLASVIHIVFLNRVKEMKPVDKIINFLKWTYDNILVDQYTLVYAILLFTNQKGIKAPKKANTNDISKIIEGCKNQAWDLSYLSNWSTFYMNRDKFEEEFIFITNDNLLKCIFINTHEDDSVNRLLFQILSKKDYNRVTDYIMERQGKRKVEDFEKKTQKYLDELIFQETLNLTKQMEE